MPRPPTPALLVRRLLQFVARVIRDAVRDEFKALAMTDALPEAPAAGPVVVATAVPERLLTLDEVAGRLGTSRRTVERILQRCELSAVHVGRQRRVHPASLDAYMRACSR